MDNPFKVSGDIQSTGWTQSERSLINARLGAEFRHIQIEKPDGTPAYDQPIIDERPGGAITVAVDLEGNLALIEVFRAAVAPADSSLPWPLPEEGLGQLGTWSLEIPRGFPKKGAAAEQTATEEPAEELGHPVRSIRLVGAVNCNTAYFVRRIPVYMAVIDRSLLSGVEPDINEKIRTADWFSANEVDTKIASGEIFCALTLGALMLARTASK